MKCLFTNIQKQQNMLKSCLLFKKNTNFTSRQLEKSQDQECEIFRLLFLLKPEYIVKFSALRQCTFNVCVSQLPEQRHKLNVHKAFRRRPGRLLTSYVRSICVLCSKENSSCNFHCVKSVCIRSFSDLYFSAFGLNTERYGVSHRIESKCGKIRTKKSPNTNTFHAMFPRVQDSFRHLRKNFLQQYFWTFSFQKSLPFCAICSVVNQ